MSSQAEAGSVTIAVTSVEPWADAAGALAPNFNLTGDQAYAKTLPVTQQALLRTLDALSGQFNAGLPSSSRIVSQEETESEGTRTSTRDETQKEEPGKAPEVNPEKITRALNDLDADLQSPLDYGKDQILQYQTATALFQEVQLLNRYLRSAALLSCHTPYLVRLQVGVNPYARRQPYDVYSRISFFVTDDEPASDAAPTPSNIVAQPQREDCSRTSNKPPQVLPLVVTDNLELSRESQARETVRQLGLAVSGLVNNLALGGQLNRLNDSLEAVAGNSLNNLTSITRVASNTIQARLGAANDPSVSGHRHAMVTRNYNVSLVVLVPTELARAVGTKYSVIGKTDLRDVNTGALLSDDHRKEAVRRLRHLQKRYNPPNWEGQDDERLYEWGWERAFEVAEERFDDFCRALAVAYGTQDNIEIA